MTVGSQRLSLLTPLLGVCLAAGIGAQSTETFVDAVDVNVVEVDVVVTDRKGRPVVDLGPEDFEIRVDGQPVEISNFHESRVFREPQASGGEDRSGTAEPPETPSDTDDTALTVVFYLDDANVRPAHRTRLLRRLEEALEPWRGANANFMLARFENRLEVLVPPTADLDAIIQQVAERPKGTARAVQEGEAAWRYVIRSLIDSHEACERMPHCRPCHDNWGELMSLARQYGDNQATNAAVAVDGLGDLVTTLAGVLGKKAVVYVTDGLRNGPASRSSTTSATDSAVIAEPARVLRRSWRWCKSTEAVDSTASPPMPTRTGSRSTVWTRLVSGPSEPTSLWTISRSRPAPRTSACARRTRRAGCTSWLRKRVARRSSTQTTYGFSLTTSGNSSRPPTPSASWRPIASLARSGSCVSLSRHTPPRAEESSTGEPTETSRSTSGLRSGCCPSPTLEGRRTRSMRASSSAARGLWRKRPTNSPVVVTVPVEKILALPVRGEETGRLRLWMVAVEQDRGARTTVRQKELLLRGGGGGGVAADGAYRFDVAIRLPEGEYRVAVGVRDETTGVTALLSESVAVPIGPF